MRLDPDVKAVAAPRPVPDRLPEIPVVAVGPMLAFDLFRAEPRRALALLDSARRQYTRLGIRLGDRRSRRWLEAGRNPYLPEIRAVADTLGTPGAYLLNLSYEWACTTGIGSDPGGKGARLLRVLDWPLEGLGRHAVIARQEGQAGPWYSVTWPGFAGVLTGAAPGRFAAAFNQAPLRRRTPFAATDWLLDRIAVGASRALPPAHLLRQVFEQCRDYGEARDRILRTPLCLPALFALSGTAPGEGCVVERLENRAVLHEAPAAIANHWLSGDIGDDLPRGDFSRERHKLLSRTLAAGPVPDFDWLLPPVRNDYTRLAVIANAATGELVVQGWESDGPATSIRRIFDPPV